MNLLHMLINDPIVLISFIGLTTVIGICSFYVYYFFKNIEENN
ncbi:DUF3149 domain-containing protein [Colwellia sp. 1_MG-2023]|nr:DUF3149 domain-containing protein [Colwellia sp. 1_MG-2023]MDO6447451.1 DUF3149 domain-containing protein [Colwellia sp. 1_MG-2023]